MKSCRLISSGEAYDGKQGLSYFSGISAESAGSEKLCMHIVTIPPGASARPHYHEAHESAIFVLEGYSEMPSVYLPARAHHDCEAEMSSVRQRSCCAGTSRRLQAALPALAARSC